MDAAAASRFETDAGARAQATARLEVGAQASARASDRLKERARALLAQAVGDAARLEGARAAAAFSPADERGMGAGIPGPFAVPPDGAGPSLEASPSRSPDAAGRAMELVERVETFLRWGRPALSLTLRGTMAGRVEVQRVGAGTVSLRLESVRQPAASELAALETALRGCGLTVQAMEVRPLSPAVD
jgi:hypothetical protein